MGLMPIVKKLALGILSPLFIVLLFATAFDIGFVRTVTHPATVKKLVADSGVYNSVTSNLLSQTGTISTSLGDVPTSDPAIQQAAKVALPPQFIQENTEMAIDNIYDWLDGRIAQPDFSIDLTGAKTLFANNVADSVQKRLNGLPACSAAESRAIVQSGSFDAYNAACLPTGISPATVAEQVKSGILSNRSFLSNTTLTAASVKNGGSNQSLFSGQLKNAPKQYQNAKKTPFILAVLTILTGAGIVFLSRSWQRGLRHIGINLLVIGLVMLLFSWGLNRAAANDIVPKIKFDNAVFERDIRNLTTDLVQQIDRNYWFFGGLYTVLGVGGIAAAEVFRRRSEPAKAPASADALGGDTPDHKPA